MLPRAISHVSKTLKDVASTISPLESNVYSKGERMLLAWLNHHYAHQRTTVFGTEGIVHVHMKDWIWLNLSMILIILYCF